jgi:SAM-dependent methyltransferase
MMFGLRDEFTYYQCSVCDCLQIGEFPPDISKYYPDNYYSFSQDFTKLPVAHVRELAQKHVSFYLSKININRQSKILDVGSGSGMYIYFLREIGFMNALGIDLYLDESIQYDNGARVIKETVHNMGQQWDLIMFNHSFEHIPDPLETLQQVSRLLAEGGVCLIRIPTVSSYAWQHYGVNWVQLDAPRHFFLHSTKSINILAEKAGLRLREVVYDSTEFQFLGSEQYLRGISLYSDRSYSRNPAASIFSQSQVEVFKTRAQQMNRQNRGDQAAFYLAR